MTKHSPGPWRVIGISQDTGEISIGVDRIVIAYATNAASFGEMLVGAMKRGGGTLRQDDCATQFANARVIAASPDLLVALKMFRDHYPHGINPDLDNAFRLAGAAIAKAEGT